MTTTVTPTTNPEFAAATHILFGPLARKVPDGAIDCDRERIDWPLIEANCYSSTEALLCRAARDLFAAGDQWDEVATIGELVRRLDDHLLRAVLDAIAILRPGVRR